MTKDNGDVWLGGQGRFSTGAGAALPPSDLPQRAGAGGGGGPICLWADYTGDGTCLLASPTLSPDLHSHQDEPGRQRPPSPQVRVHRLGQLCEREGSWGDMDLQRKMREQEETHRPHTWIMTQ